MRALRFSDAAHADLLAIGRHSAERWGAVQRNHYLAALFAACEAPREFPLSGKPRDELFLGMRSLPAEKHIIYYFVTEDAVLIAGILHARMDPTSHLA